MASAAFDLGFQENRQRQDEKRAQKQQEHAQKINDLFQQRKALVDKIPTLQQGTPEYDQAHTALQGVVGDIAEAYRPDKHPGAIQNLGHLITDHMGITKPEERAQKQAVEVGNKKIAAGQAADRLIAAAPPSAEQTAVQGARAKSAAANAGYQADISSFKTTHPNATPEEISAHESELNQKYYGDPGKGDWTSVSGMLDGNPTNLLYSKNRHQYLSQGGSPIPPEIADKFVPDGKVTTAAENIKGYNEAVALAQKEGRPVPSYPEYMAEQRRKGAPSTSALNEGREDYAKSHGYKSYGEIPDEYRDLVMNYEIRKQALDKAYPTSTTSSHLQQDAAGQYHNVTETNYKTPGGQESLKDPLWFLSPPVPSPHDAVQQRGGASTGSKSTPSTNSSTSAAPGGTSTTPTPSRDPKALKKEVEARAPKTPSGSGGAPKPSSDGSTTLGNVKISTPLFAAKNKAYDDAQTAYESAVARVHTMEKSAAEANKGDQQAMLSLVANHIGMTLGAQKGARINQAVWNEAVESAPGIDKILSKFGHFDTNGDWVLDTPFKGYKGGVTLTGDQIKSMVKLAHEQVGTFKDNRDQILKRLNQGVQIPIQNPDGNGSGGGQPSPNGLPKGWN
jgi:hypothetical protein